MQALKIGGLGHSVTAKSPNGSSKNKSGCDHVYCLEFVEGKEQKNFLMKGS